MVKTKNDSSLKKKKNNNLFLRIKGKTSLEGFLKQNVSDMTDFEVSIFNLKKVR